MSGILSFKIKFTFGHNFKFFCSRLQGFKNRKGTFEKVHRTQVVSPCSFHLLPTLVFKERTRFKRQREDGFFNGVNLSILSSENNLHVSVLGSRNEYHIYVLCLMRLTTSQHYTTYLPTPSPTSPLLPLHPFLSGLITCRDNKRKLCALCTYFQYINTGNTK